MSYAQKFGLSRNSPLLRAEEDLTNTPLEPKVVTDIDDPNKATKIISDNNEISKTNTLDLPMFETKKKWDKYFNDRPKDLSFLENIKYNINSPKNPSMGGNIGAVSWLTGGGALSNLGNKGLQLYNKLNKIPKIRKGYKLAQKLEVPSTTRISGGIGFTSKIASKMASFFAK